MKFAGKIILKNLSFHNLGFFATVIFTFLLANIASAQTNITDTTKIKITPDSLVKTSDSLKNDSLITKDSTTIHSLEDSLGITISKDALPSPVTTTARDSAVMDMKGNLFYLYGDAKVDYEDMKLAASKITYNQNSSIVTASHLEDSATIVKKNSFTQGTETFTYDSLQYNFKSKRAIVRNARSQYGEGFVHSQQVKRNPDQSIYGFKSVYTTCSLDTPHFGIRAKKIKVIPNRIIASGPANLEIEGVPTPLYLPFGIFPVNQTQRSGFKLPTYTIEEQRGIGLLNGGYYFYINDYVDLLLTGNIYSKGSWLGNAVSTYANKYHYSGGLSLNYAYNKTGEVYEPTASTNKTFRINWRHATDPKAKPGETFNASVDIGSSSFYSQNSINVNQIIQNQYLSNITYAKNWVNKPYSLTVSTTFNQDATNHYTTVNLPTINFYVSQFNPLHNKNAIGTHWYDKFTMSYTVNAINQASFYDSTFSQLSFNNFQNGIHHTIPVSASYNVLRFFNLSFNANYNEYWLTKKSYHYFNTNEYKIDTSRYNGFYTARDFDASVSLSTRIYGMKLFKKGKLMGIRHVITPSISMGYLPDYAAAPWNYYYRTSLDATGTPQYISPFESSVIGIPGRGQAGNFSSTLNYGLDNNLQIKVRNGKDSVTGSKNISLIDGLSLNGSYNIAADSFNWSRVNISFRTNILNALNISAGANFDPYAKDYETGRVIPKTNLSLGRGLVRFTDASISLSGSLHSKEKTTNSNKQAEKSDEYSRLMQHGGYNDYIDFNIPWRLNVSYNFRMSKVYDYAHKRDTLAFDQNILLNGDFNLTPRWKVAFTTGYNVTTKQISISSFDIYRDLHCWEMRLGTIPFGPNKNYNFTLNVKASILQDLRLIRRRDYRDAL